MTGYTIDGTGHIACLDSAGEVFVFPKSFEEYYSRFPGHVRTVLYRHASWLPDERKEDIIAEVHAHLCVPYDRIASFDPERMSGRASPALWFHFVNTIVANKVRTITDRDSREPTCRTDNALPTDLHMGYVETSPDSSLRLQELVGFVSGRDPEAGELLRTYIEGGGRPCGWVDAANSLGISPITLRGLRSRLSDLIVGFRQMEDAEAPAL